MRPLRSHLRPVVLVALAFAAPSYLAGCAGSEPTGAGAGAAEPTLADVRSRALAAVSRPGLVLHLTSVAEQGGRRLSSEVWLDLERRLASIDRDGQPEMAFSADTLAMRDPMDGRYREAPYSWPGLEEPLVGFTLDYLERLLAPGAVAESITSSTEDGQARLVVEVGREVNADGFVREERARVTLDRDYLPVTMDVDFGDGRVAELTVAYEVEHVPRDDAPADVFSFERIRAAASSSEDVLRSAAAGFAAVYWLGDPFEKMVLQTVFGDEGGPARGVIGLGYGEADARAGGPGAPFPCALVNEYLPETWRARRAEVDPQLPAAEPVGTVPALGTTAQLFRDRAVVELTDVVIEVSVACGPEGSNPYRSGEGLERLLAALRPLGPG